MRETDLSEAGPPTIDGRNPRLRRDLRLIFVEGMIYAAIVGISEAYFALLALEAGLGQVLAGLIVTIPNMLGAMVALSTPRLLRHAAGGSLRAWVLWCVAAQSTVFLVLAACSWWPFGQAGQIPALLLFAVITIYWSIMYSAATVWTTWMGLIIPASVRTHYFAFRSRVYNVVLPAAIIGAGLLFHAADDPATPGDVLPWFAGVFLAAGLLRYATLAFFAVTSPARLEPGHAAPIPLRSVLARYGKGPDGRLLLILTTIPLARFLGEAYFTPFARVHLQFEYDRMFLLIGALFGAKALGLPIAGRLSRVFGPWRVLVASGLLLAPIPLLWLVSTSFAWLLLAQALAGIVIGAVELSGWLCVYDLIHPRDRASLWSFYQVCNTTAMAAGSLAGGAVLDALGGSDGAYTGVFALSGALRLALPGLLLLLWWSRGKDAPPSPHSSDLPGPIESEGA
jgi:Major Facilitator Superfamily